MNDGPRPRRQQIADQDRHAAEAEMRRIGENSRHQRQIADAVDQDAEIEIGGSGQVAEHAVGEVEDAEQLEKQFRGAARRQRRVKAHSAETRCSPSAYQVRRNRPKIMSFWSMKAGMYPVRITNPSRAA